MIRRLTHALALAALLLSLGGCGGDSGRGGDDAASRLTAGSSSPDRGELLALACLACHALTPAGGPDIGPSLYGVFGRRAASVAGFEYSDALRNAQFVWTPERLDAWLQAPTRFLPGTTMVFAGYGDQRDRDALITWLQAATQTATE